MGAAIFIGFGGIQAYTSDVTPKGNVGFSWRLIMGLQVLTRSLMLIPFGLIGDLFNLRSSSLFLAIVLGIGTIPAIWVKEEKAVKSDILPLSDPKVQ
ncbi:MAG: hypothetical protein ACW976_04440, partial [Candidatus Ranarchaeia archaeon]|jgi:glycopeptide antibiotics resistance protein